MTFEEGMKQNIVELVEKKTALEKRIFELEKENAELKEQFSNAKEIIEGLMRFCRCFAQHHTEDIRYKEAEEFLKCK